MKLKHFLYVNKEGAIIGGIIGLFLAWSGFNFPVAQLSSSTLMNYLSFIITLGGAGILLDHLYMPNK